MPALFHSSPFSRPTCSFKPQNPFFFFFFFFFFLETITRYNSNNPRAAARDRVIDFGKYKGRMLGSLASSYLKWVSKNLRARDFEDWAKLADHVLQDPVYQDRREWELAHSVLNVLLGDINVEYLLPYAERKVLEGERARLEKDFLHPQINLTTPFELYEAKRSAEDYCMPWR